MLNLTLRGKVMITGAIEAVTGLHIGGAAAGLDIGGIDNPVIRHPVTREPYIPGSSLRGKMRSLLDKHLGLEANKFIQRREPVVRVHECDQEDKYRSCPACQIFGVTPGDQRRDWNSLKPSRLIVRDVLLSQTHEATRRLREAKTDLPFTEVKWEAAIDRITAAAVPRQNERVPAGAVFSPFEMVYNLFDLNGTGIENDIQWLTHLFKAMELLEDDYLGGYGSRGAGKIAFRELRVLFKSRAYYEGKIAEPVVLGEGNTLRDLNVSQFAEKIRQNLGD
jgi:CRISPR-associated protein Csm3